jgi:hypothetical protein
MVLSTASSIVDVVTLYIVNGIFVSFEIVWQYVRSVETKSSEITAILVVFLFLKKCASIELSNPPDNAINLALQELQDSSKM